MSFRCIWLLNFREKNAPNISPNHIVYATPWHFIGVMNVPKSTSSMEVFSLIFFPVPSSNHSLAVWFCFDLFWFVLHESLSLTLPISVSASCCLSVSELTPALHQSQSLDLAAPPTPGQDLLLLANGSLESSAGSLATCLPSDASLSDTRQPSLVSPG